MPAAQLPERFNHQAAALAAEGGTIVGLSGGRDSVALLLMLKAAGCRHLTACHINHCIRGAEADADEQFCAELCRRLSIPFISKKIDVPALAASSGQSLETAARHVRRAVFAATAEQFRATAVALAHHADDQAETVIFNLARGSSGARGMKAVDTFNGLRLLRPLLNVSRSEITHWLTAQQETWREDSTNSVADVSRNRIRHEVLPALNSALGRDVAPILCRSARIQEENMAALDAALCHLPILDPQNRLYIPFVLEQGEPLRKAIVRYFLKLNKVPQIDEAMVSAVNAILSPAESKHSRLCLPSGAMAIRRNKRLIIEHSVKFFG